MNTARAPKPRIPVMVGPATISLALSVTFAVGLHLGWWSV
jgi:hypothetical protein